MPQRHRARHKTIGNAGTPKNGCERGSKRDEREHPVRDGRRAERVEHGRLPARADVFGHLTKCELAQTRESVGTEEVVQRHIRSLV